MPKRSHVGRLLPCVPLLAACATGTAGPATDTPVTFREPSAGAQRAADRARAGTAVLGRLWTFEDVRAGLTNADGLPVSAPWLERAAEAAVRVGELCSGAIVSPQGLVLTTQSCVRECLAAASRTGRDAFASGAHARSRVEEYACPGLVVDQLIETRDVGVEIERAAAAVPAAQAETARRTEIARLEQRCGAEAGRVCQVTQLWNGARPRLYVYRRYGDARLVFAPEAGVADFGGGAGYLAWPRHSLDFALIRLYGRDGRAAQTPGHFVLDVTAPVVEQVAYVVSSPLASWRLATMSQLAYERDIRQPQNVRLLEGLASILDHIADDPDARRSLRDDLFTVRGSLELTRAQLRTMHDTLVVGARLRWERDLRTAVAADPDLHRRFGDVWDRMLDVQRAKAALSHRLNATNIDILGAPHLLYARELIAYVRALAQPPERRPRAYTGERLRAIEEDLFRGTRVDDATARRFLRVHVDLVNAWVPQSDEIRASLLRPGETPEQATTRLADGSALLDPTFREELAKLGPRGIATSADPLLRHVALIDSLRYELSDRWQVLSEREQVERRRLGQAVLAVYGPGVGSDATFSPRLADGHVRPYTSRSTALPPFTTFYGMYERAAAFAGAPAWSLPAPYVQARRTIELDTPLNFVLTADGFGAGGAVVNRAGRLQGIVAGANSEHLANRFTFLGGDGRVVAVHAAAIVHVLSSVYRADRIVNELEIEKGRE